MPIAMLTEATKLAGDQQLVSEYILLAFLRQGSGTEADFIQKLQSMGLDLKAAEDQVLALAWVNPADGATEPAVAARKRKKSRKMKGAGAEDDPVDVEARPFSDSDELPEVEGEEDSQPARPLSDASNTVCEVLQLAVTVHNQSGHVEQNMHNSSCFAHAGLKAANMSAHAGGNPQSEHLFIGMMLHPKSIARHIVESCSDGAVTSRTLLVSLGIPVDTFTEKLTALRASWPHPWQDGSVGDGVPVPVAAELPAAVVDDLEQMRGPTSESNWLVPGRVVLGEVPGSYSGPAQAAVDSIIDAGVDTFVCLLEWNACGSHDGWNAYLRNIEKALSSRAGRSVNWLWFPIDDFSTANDADTIAFVEELGRRVAAGNKLYIHCYSGRGRTGTIAIPLFMSMYPELSELDARRLVNEYKRKGRTGGTKGGHMPEDDTQLGQIAEGEIQYKRGGHKAKQHE